jgi:GNAT superfamily N-acetyltransferase
MASREAGPAPARRFALLADPFPLLMRAKLCLHAFRLTEKVTSIEPLTEVDFQIIQADSAEISDLLKFTDHELIRWRFSQGELCWVARAEGDIVSYVWAAFERQRVEELCNAIELQEGEVYLYDAFTLPEWRGKALYPAILSRQLEYFKQQGYKRALIFTVEENMASRRGITRAGFHHFQTIELTKVINFALYIYGPKTPQDEVDVTFGPWRKPF